MKINTSIYFIFIACLSGLISCSPEDEIPHINIIKSGEFSWEDKDACVIIYTTAEGSVEMPADIKYRGGHSARYDKHSFSLELIKKYPLAGLPKDDDWILNASYIDKTFMRHKLSYDLFSDMGRYNLSAASSYVEVSVNDQPQGLYLITEEINGRQVNLDKKDSLAMLFKDPPILYEGRIPNPQDTNNYYQQKFPKIGKRDQTYYLEELRTFIFDSSEQEFSDNIEKWLDISNVMDWHLLLMYSYNADGIMKNFYLYKLDSTTPFRIAIWDYDHSFGRDGDNELNMMDRSMRLERSILFNRLLASEHLKYNDKLRERWAELRQSGLFSRAYMVNKMAAIDDKIYKSVEHNVEIWPWESQWYYDDNNYEKEKEIILKFVDIRLDVLDRKFGYNK